MINENVLIELEAVENVRLELELAMKRNAPLSEVMEIHGRLISLYASLDIHNVISIVSHSKFKKSA